METNYFVSAYCVGFSDFRTLEKWLRDFGDFPVGIEHMAYWPENPGVHEDILAAADLMKGFPTTIHAPIRDILNEPGTEEYEKVVRLYEKAAELFHVFHARSMVIHTHEKPADPEKGRAASKQRILEIAEFLQDRGIPVNVENVGYPARNNVLFRQDDFVKLFSELPESIGCLIDTGHAMLNRWDICGVIRTLGSRIRGFHLNNNDGIHDAHYPCFRKGAFYDEKKMTEVLETIAGYSPEAELILEYAPGPEMTEEILHEELRRIRSIAG